MTIFVVWLGLKENLRIQRKGRWNKVLEKGGKERAKDKNNELSFGVRLERKRIQMLFPRRPGIVGRAGEFID